MFTFYASIIGADVECDEGESTYDQILNNSLLENETI